MPKAIRINKHGGPEVLKYEEVSVGEPGKGEIRVRHAAVGLNFLDCYFRSGLYPAPNGLPLTPGNEAAGVVVAIGDGVADLSPGDRIAYAGGPIGAYAQERIMPADRVVKVPDSIGDEQAAAMMLQGMTAEYLLRRTFKVKSGDTIMYHAAAGGVGLLLGQWAKHLGATAIGTVSTPAKADLARAHGYDHVIVSTQDNFVEKVADITNGRKCDVVYDGVGKDTFEGSLDCIRPLGMLVSFGQSSGSVAAFNPAVLAQKGSLFLTRPTLFTYIANRDDLLASANALFEVVSSGAVKIRVNQRYALADAAKAHEDLEGRRTTGATVLLP
jgi:NADPH2:quinone reductase